MPVVYSAIVENGTGIVRQFVPGDAAAGVTPGIPEPGETAYPVSEAEAAAYYAWIATDPSEADYVRNPDGTFQVVEWPDIPAVINKTNIIGDGVDTVRISGLPNPTKVIIQGGGAYNVTDGNFEFTYDAPGVLQVVCDSPGFKPVSFVIRATP